MDYHIEYRSPYGVFVIESDGESITAILRQSESLVIEGLKNRDCKLPIFEDAKRWFDTYFAGQEPTFMLPLVPKGTPFRQDVWKILSAIPYGELLTYGDIAKSIAQQRGVPKMSAQAVGGAVGSNPIPIIIPCHRVVGTNGNLTGYRGGVDAKIKLLTLEGVDMSLLHTPL